MLQMDCLVWPTTVARPLQVTSTDPSNAISELMEVLANWLTVDPTLWEQFRNSFLVTQQYLFFICPRELVKRMSSYNRKLFCRKCLQTSIMSFCLHSFLSVGTFLLVTTVTSNERTHTLMLQTLSLCGRGVRGVGSLLYVWWGQNTRLSLNILRATHSLVLSSSLLPLKRPVNAQQVVSISPELCLYFFGLEVELHPLVVHSTSSLLLVRSFWGRAKTQKVPYSA